MAQDSGAETGKQENAVEQASRSLREAILSGVFRPGERLKLASLTEMLDCSVMPLREALRLLEGQGLIEFNPNKGAVVRRIDRAYITDIYDLNTELRVMALRNLRYTLTLDRIERLAACQRAYDAAVSAGDDEAALNENRRFNSLLVEFGGNAEALRIFVRGWEMIYAFRHSYGYGGTRRQGLGVEMALIVNALRRHDFSEAEALLRMQNAAVMEDLFSRLPTSETT
ncbi:GntR family transcriptional regulator [Sinirhodobacter populi]|uniref:GntR family transcriptional regulator n=1 Tax=Paenirhodobacter populi TaxID=2306993 RepID=A0A443K340_9RHOB|nr:GntR family transcriptional regulator [Sinirhodobacter populi]RWR27178.1 GntR family transcriptional regulator [Sinirhodobacter populi]